MRRKVKKNITLILPYNHNFCEGLTALLAIIDYSVNRVQNTPQDTDIAAVEPRPAEELPERKHQALGVVSFKKADRLKGFL
jgi:hypothetical protein